MRGARRLGLVGSVLLSAVAIGGADAQPLPPPAPGPLPSPHPVPIGTGVWGFADLHTHPAVHMALGAEDDGTGGIFYGKPGVKLEDNTMASDLAPCDREKHGRFDGDFVRHETRQTIMQKVNQITGHTHGSSGYPDFKTWPNAGTTNHQQMHIQWIKRAFDGGLRILVASAMDNLSFRTLWRNGYNIAPPQLRANKADEFASAVRQLDFIHRVVAANSSWMAIAKSPAEAREAIRNNKLAVILGTELDTLTADQLIQLKQTKDVRLVIPAHVADSPIAGSAVYENLFNSHNWFLNGDFFHVVGDSNLKVRLTKPSYLGVQTSIWPLDGSGAIAPNEIGQGQYCGLKYECCPAPNNVAGCIPSSQGHKNEKGIVDPNGFKRLMQQGLLIDLAHMSDVAQTDAVRLASTFRYPMLDSHTGMRDDHQRSENERAIRKSLMKTLADLGGVMGMGTGGITSGGEAADRRVFMVDGWNFNDGKNKHRMVRFTGEQHDAVFSIGPYKWGSAGQACATASVTIRTGGDDLRGGNDNARITFHTRTGPAVLALNGTSSWGNGSVNAATVPMPPGTRVGDITGVTLTHTGDTNSGGAGSDNWNVDAITIDCTGPATSLLDMRGGPLMRFTGDNKNWRAPLDNRGTGEVRALSIKIFTGGDDLRGGNDNAIATIDLGGTTVECPLNGGANWGNDSWHTVRCALPEGTQRSSVREIRIRTTFSGGFNGDNWNMDQIQVFAEIGGARLLAQTGTPLIRFTAEQRARILYTPVLAPVASPSDMPATSILKLWVWTTTDDLRGENDNARLVLEFRDGSTQEVAMNDGGKWDGGDSSKESKYNVMVRLEHGKTWSDIRNVRIKTNFTGGLNGDNWDIGQLSLEAYPDPMKAWTRELEGAMSFLGEGKVALGSDLNGLAPQIPMTSMPPTRAFIYPREMQPPAPGRTVALANSRAGNRTFEFANDGIAHIGMEPDFLYVAQQVAGPHKIAPMFKSAEMVIQMWEKVEAAAGSVR